MPPFDSLARNQQRLPAARTPLSSARRASLIHDAAISMFVPALAERFRPGPGLLPLETTALVDTLPEMPLHEAVRALAALNPGGRRFEPICRDILLPAASRLRRRYDPAASDQSARLARVWHLRMCLLSLDDEGPGPRIRLAGLHSVLVVSGATGLPSLEHSVAMRFLGRAGWDVSDCGGEHADDACESAHDRDFDVAWISLEPGMTAAAIRRTVGDLRRASRNAGILVLGGGVSPLRPGSPAELDLDGYTGSAVEAARVADAAMLGREAGLPAG